MAMQDMFATTAEEEADARRLTIARRSARRCGEEMRRDPTVFLMGEDIGAYGGAFGAAKGLLERVRAGAGARHADLRGRLSSGAARRRGRDRAAAGGRAHVHRLHRPAPWTRS